MGVFLIPQCPRLFFDFSNVVARMDSLLNWIFNSDNIFVKQFQSPMATNVNNFFRYFISVQFSFNLLLFSTVMSILTDVEKISTWPHKDFNKNLWCFLRFWEVCQAENISALPLIWQNFDFFWGGVFFCFFHNDEILSSGFDWRIDLIFDIQ